MENNVMGGILAGGRGTRLGGVDKGLAVYQGTPLIEHALQVMRPQVSSVMISANRNHSTYQAYNTVVLEDVQSGFNGPLSGLYQLLRHCSKPYLFCMPVDCPNVPNDCVSQMLQELEQTHYDAVLLHDAQGCQPLIGLYKSGLHESLQVYLASGQQRVFSWVDGLNTGLFQLKSANHELLNLNTAEDFS